MNGRVRPTSDLLAPTPFALHFSPEAEGDREEVDPHSWCSRSPHPVPSSSRHSQALTELTGTSADLASTRSVENAVVTRASAAWRRSVKQLAFSSPQSAPAQLPGFEQARHPRKILESQVKFAAQLEEHDNQQKSSKASTPEPLQLAKGLQMPLLTQRSRVAIAASDETESSTGYLQTPGSMVYGSDIIQLSPTRRRAEDPAPRSPRSPAYTQSSFNGIISPDSRRSTYQSFASSRLTEHTSDESESRSAISPRTSRSHGLLSPQSSIMRFAPRVANRISFASVRSRTTEEMGTARSDGSHSSAKKAVRSKRRTFGQQSISSLRKSRRADAVTDLVLPQEPMPPVLAHLRHASSPVPASEDAGLSVPEVQFLPATPEPAEAIVSPRMVTSPSYWVERPMSGKVKGPRPLPSAWLAGSGWPQQEEARPMMRAGSRRNSYPAPHSQESFRSIVDRRRPSVA